jgi:hypothetical protein|tara:strand:- start:106 stop:459 length:354 start_codon:yes stop_codon:yes gene_type:complete
MTALIAFLDSNNEVTQVVQCPDDGQDWAAIWSERYSCTCKETSLDGSIRHQYATPGSVTYYPDLDAFISNRPYPSWSLNTTSKEWEAPVSKPTDGFNYSWNENDQAWDRDPDQLGSA